jgi:ACS family hexuronate transporter-like MFS transporter
MAKSTDAPGALRHSSTEPSGWRMWVPCMAMGACSWLAFVDRQVLAVLSPTILADTGLTAETYAQAFALFNLAYMIANPIWGSVLDRIGLRVGLIIAVAFWSAASVSHAFMTGFFGFALARALLGFGEGATFPGGFRTAVESLPLNRRARGIATSFSGGAIGAILTPIIVIPIGVRYGWRTAFLLSGLLGLLWIVLWLAASRPPYLPKTERKTTKLALPNFLERRVWALMIAYSLTTLSIGPILAIVPLYFSDALGVPQADLGRLLWAPPFAWAVGYFFWGWAADRFAGDTPRPINMLVLLTILALPIGATTWTSSPALAMVLIAWTGFIVGGFQMVVLKANSYAFPPEQSAMMMGTAGGAWSGANVLFLPLIGRWFGQGDYTEAFLLMALLPIVGLVLWLLLSQRPEEVVTQSGVS